MNNNLTKIIDGKIQFKIGNEYKDIINYCTDTCWAQCWRLMRERFNIP